ncbi:TRAP transporter small permease [Lampropedia puyangensis]|uniref:TRAP transporter small permease protein n=1 Tax=Lampropedia puyangensis TaxID=1330072 RepID=A0A4S8ERT8_9BURK|nr:TRAP transporter small permease [Lampropedia puyangensis]THT97589.1 TRAP transporter small permease [Lampropedia puyangensis]
MAQCIYGLSRFLAWLGGVVLILLASISVISIAGRALSGFGLGPIPGDFELVEAGTALAVFCFMPWAHLVRSHAVVDLFWGVYPAAMQRVLIILSDLLMLVLWVLLIWRMGVAMVDYRSNGELTFILQFPVWWGYAASLIPAVFGCVVYAWRLLEDLGLTHPPAGFVAAKGGH